jgi:hypothetical protein
VLCCMLCCVILRCDALSCVLSRACVLSWLALTLALAWEDEREMRLHIMRNPDPKITFVAFVVEYRYLCQMLFVSRYLLAICMMLHVALADRLKL